MATLSDLVQTVAEVEGIDPATVGLIARHLREGGLITSGGRGLSAARMTVTDAANLLIGVNAARSAVEAFRVVPVYRRLQSFEFRSRTDPRPPQRLGALGDAIEQLLDAIGKGQMPDEFMGQLIEPGFQEAFGREEVVVKLRFRMSTPMAQLEMEERYLDADDADPANAEQFTAMVSPRIVLTFRPPRGPPPRHKPVGDRIEDTSIGYATLRAVGQLIS